MAGSVNKVILVGNLERDPEIRTSQQGKKIANLAIATSERRKDQQGEWQEKTEWHKVVIFNDGLAGVVEQYYHKGDMVYVEGSLATRKWTDQQGQEKYTTEIVIKAFNGTVQMLNSRPTNGNEPTTQYKPKQASKPSGGGWDSSMPNNNDLDDEIPF